MDEIKRELLELNFDVDSIGVIYWIYAIRLIKKDTLEIETTQIYQELANRYNKSTRSIQRAMIKALEPAKENIKKKYKYDSEIKNQTFLNIMRLKYT